MRRTIDDLSAEVAALGDLDRDALAKLWEKTHGQPPPKALRNDLLARSAAWHLQAKRLGGLSTSARRLLKEAMAAAELGLAKRNSILHAPSIDAEDGAAVSGPQRLSEHPSAGGQPKKGVRRARAIPSPGARLIREWNGKSHVVDVIEGGFVFQAKVHKSLTAIADQITGAHWSGPRFFGL